MIVVAVLIASPVTWWFIKNWLESYPYRMPIYWWVFLFTGIIALALALIAVSIQTLKAANRNPAESLKYE